jgi:hypothetical protein
MAWVGVGVGVVGLAGGVASGMASRGAAKEQKQASKQLRKDIWGASYEIEGYAQEYTDFMQDLDTNFDPYNMEQAFDSLYEAVIQPMERDFDENVLPGIQAAYSGGIMGQGAGLSGAASSAEASAQRDLSEKKADLRYQERGAAIQRNYLDFARKQDSAGLQFGAQQVAPMMRSQGAGQVFEATSQSIASSLAAKQQLAQAPGQALSTGLGGYQAFSAARYNNTANDYLKSKSGSTLRPNANGTVG